MYTLPSMEMESQESSLFGRLSQKQEKGKKFFLGLFYFSTPEDNLATKTGKIVLCCKFWYWLNNFLNLKS